MECKVLAQFVSALKDVSRKAHKEFYVDATSDYKGEDTQMAAAGDSSHRFYSLFEVKDLEGVVLIHPVDILLDSEEEIAEWRCGY